jgi:hypothetical protein
MKIKWFVVSALNALLVFAVLGCSSDESADGKPAEAVALDTDETTSSDPAPVFPRPIMTVTPKPGEEICQPASLSVRFKLNDSMILNGRHDEAAFELFMDGRNIKREVEFFPSQVFPETHVALLHAMWVYDPGPHTARVEFIGDDGDTEYEWQFTVKEGCPKSLR